MKGLFALSAWFTLAPGALAGAAYAETPAIEAALASPDRLEGDATADPRRRPGAVLAFFGIEPGMTVLDLYSGGGYYTEIVSRVVGPAGAVVAHNNTPYLKFSEEQLRKRYRGGRLPNVERLTAENNALTLDAGRFDAVLMILAYHDIYYDDDSIGWEPIDGPSFLAEVLEGLRPGGILGVVDHAADAGAPASVGDSLHRIDPARLRAEIEGAGFVFEGESKVLRNFSDDRSLPMYDPAIRGRTDRIVYRFRKPR
jgi:predicted methyltransferase